MASYYELDEILHPRVITESYREEAGKFFSNPLVDFYGSQSRDISGDNFEFAYRATMNEPAPANFRGQPARVLQPTGLSDRKIYMLRAFNEVNLSMDALHMIRRPDDMTLQSKGRDEIMRQFEDFGDRHLIFRAVALAKTLVDGVVYLGSEGQILEDLNGAVCTVDFGLAASHKTQITAASSSFSGAIIDFSWDDPTALILDQLDNIRQASSEINAEGPMEIWVNHAMKKNLRNNNQFAAYFETTPQLAEQVLRGDFMQGIGGYNWHFYSGTYKAADGTTKPYIPVNKAIITPPNGPWMKAANGSELITNHEGLAGSVDEALGKITEVFGDFSYVKLVDNPTKLVLRMGTNFVYAFANPNAVWAPTVVF